MSRTRALLLAVLAWSAASLRVSALQLIPAVGHRGTQSVRSVAMCAPIETIAAPTAAAEPAAAPAATPDAPDAVREALDLLEWPRLSAQVASFASTRHVRDAMDPGLPLGATRAESLELQSMMVEARYVEADLGRPLPIDGFGDVAPLASRARKGGVLEGHELATLAESLGTAGSLRTALRSAAEEAEASETAPSVVLLPALFEGVPLQAELRREIGSAIDESGEARAVARRPTFRGRLTFAHSPTIGSMATYFYECRCATRRLRS